MNAGPSLAAASAAASGWLARVRDGQGAARLAAMLGGSALIAVAAAAWLWTRGPDMGVLYANLSDRDGGAIVASLQQMNVPYEFAGGGSVVRIPAAQVPEVRLKLAAQGLPKGGNVGFELMDQQKFGTSQFHEQVNYQRALEGELARSIGAIGAVQSARVHLALPKPSLFVREAKKPSASVVLALHPGRSLDEAQVSAITHLVSSGVPDLSVRAISIVDQAGRLLTAPEAVARGGDLSQLRYTLEMEQAYIRRIEAILHPILGAGNVHAQVSAEIDFSVAETTQETFRPNQEPGEATIRSQQRSESNTPGAVAGGVPGALSNQPPADPAAPITGNSTARNEAAAKGGSGPARKDETTNYEVDRTLRHVQGTAGSVRRLSAAVVINHRTHRNGTRQALTVAELQEISALVREAVGLREDRGDTLSVANSAFAGDASGVPGSGTPQSDLRETLAWGQAFIPWLLVAVAILAGWLFIARPMLRRRRQAQEAPAAPETPLAVNAEEATPDHQPTPRHQDNLRYAQALAQDDPRMVAMLINDWIGPQ